MSVGFTASKADYDQRAGAIALDLRSVMERIRRLQIVLVAKTNQELLDAGYVQADVDTLKSAFVDLDKLAQVYYGLATQATTYDFQTFAKRLTGVV